MVSVAILDGKPNLPFACSLSMRSTSDHTPPLPCNSSDAPHKVCLMIPIKHGVNCVSGLPPLPLFNTTFLLSLHQDRCEILASNVVV